MIGKAVYSLLNVSAVTNLANDISPNQASRNAVMPYIVFNEQGTPENYKDDYDIVYYNLQIDVYAEQTNAGGGGKAACIAISDEIQTILHRYKGTVENVVIENCVLQDKESLYDPVSEAERIMLTYRVRVKESAPAPNEGIGFMVIGSTFIVA